MKITSHDDTRVLPGPRHFLRADDGAALVEFAVVLPLLLLLFFGIITWGGTLALVDNMYDAARQAARQLSVGTASEAAAAANATAYLSTWPNSFTVTAQDIGTTGTDDVRVIVATANPFAGMFTSIVVIPDLQAVVTMRKE
ncbi:TadE/TadG family type IV pilus assembly protein [Candidatus Halocynthiibacter alkanivorans]|uniref:TadE/TadG family type IV pilus assembly protein n=1 Tax=Candidatus Halocynthiibacter alkanivorans TaxID=2267619 RepID=UPI00135B621A|nr:TadE/TadG family type IV pilus assembly protein [Candidatus Halocynthiibacter alkanivorans]